MEIKKEEEKKGKWRWETGRLKTKITSWKLVSLFTTRLGGGEEGEQRESRERAERKREIRSVFFFFPPQQLEMATITLEFEVSQLVIGGLVVVVSWYLWFIWVPFPTRSLRGKRILITGAGHGIGRRMALNFIEKDPSVELYLWDIRLELLEKVEREIKEKRRGVGEQLVRTYVCDVSNKTSVIHAAECLRRDIVSTSCLPLPPPLHLLISSFPLRLLPLLPLLPLLLLSMERSTFS
jgi:hypothetical protein